MFLLPKLLPGFTYFYLLFKIFYDRYSPFYNDMLVDMLY